MRYLDRNRATDSLHADVDTATALMEAFGPYCAYCEDFLPDDCIVWNKQTGEGWSTAAEGPGRSSMDNWEDRQELLLLCKNCFKSQQRFLDVPRLFPDESDSIFPLHGRRTLSYRLEKVHQIILAENDDILTASAVGETDCVILASDNPIIELMIKVFELNSPYLTNGKMIIPELDYFALSDRRVERRTNAWRMTQEICYDLMRLGVIHYDENTAVGSLDAILTQVRNTFISLGFWSTCISAFRSYVVSNEVDLGHGEQLIGRIFTPIWNRAYSDYYS